ncbi:MAG: conjugal transfer protein TraX [Lachnospiraceae bacterium]|nr:conjugal transfer protein TraX [Lachnospiraceae bacterium]
MSACRDEERTLARTIVREQVAGQKKNSGGSGSPFGLTGSMLKWIAIVTMFIDHVGGCLLEVYFMNSHGNSPYKGFWDLPSDQMTFWFEVDIALRCIGRLAFPIFCFLLVEGFLHTRNVKKYALRLGLFCLISEIPFDLAFRGEPFYWLYQNVFFTLLLGLLGIWALEYFWRRQRLVGALLAIATALVADLLHTDYGAFGVFFIELLYLFRSRVLVRNILCIGSLLLYGGLEMLGALAFLPIVLYNGTRGKQPKYFFYVFYPIHLLILMAVGRWLLPVLLCV